MVENLDGKRFAKTRKNKRGILGKSARTVEQFLASAQQKYDLQ